MGRMVTLLSKKNNVIAWDSFNRADSTTSLGTTSGGQTWLAADTLTFGILSNMAYTPAGLGWGFDLIDIAVSDFVYECDMVWATNTNGVILFRSDGTTSNRWILVVTRDATNNFQLTKTVAGAETTVASVTFTPVAGQNYRMRVECRGSTINGYLDGNLLLNVTDTALQTNTKIGIGAYAPTGIPGVKWDNLIVYGV